MTCGISNRSTFLQVPCAGALLFRVGGGQAAAGHTFPVSESHAVPHPTSLLSGRGLPRLKGKAVGPPFAGRATAVGQLLGRGGLFRPRRASQASVTLTASSWSCCFCFAPSLPVVLTQHPEGWRQGRSRPGSRPSRTPARRPRPGASCFTSQLSVPHADRIVFYPSVFPEMFPFTLPRVDS